jgi:pimeloyl-ACP methyl ester carboxylesterase
MYVKRYGAGEQSYFGLHGWSGDHRTFAPLAAHMPPGASLYSADLPGCGGASSSEAAQHALTLEAITNEIAGAVERALPRQGGITLIGNCSGAILSLLVAREIKSKLERLVLIDPFAYWPWYFRVFVNKSFGRYAYRTTFANPFGRWLTNQSLRGHRTAESDLTNSFGHVNHDVAQRYLALLSEVEGIERFAGLQSVPVDIVYGERTFGAAKKSVAMWQGIWPQARAHMLEGAGHLPILEATAALSRIVFAEQEAAKSFAANNATRVGATAAAAQAEESEAGA